MQVPAEGLVQVWEGPSPGNTLTRSLARGPVARQTPADSSFGKRGATHLFPRTPPPPRSHPLSPSGSTPCPLSLAWEELGLRGGGVVNPGGGNWCGNTCHRAY